MDQKEEENKDDQKESKNLSIPLRLRDKPMPKEAQYVTSYRTANNEENAEKIIASNGKDRRKKYDKLEKVISDKGNPVDIKKYIVKLTIKYGNKLYVGTATIIRIVNDTIFLLTAAHNVVELCEIDENKRFDADGIWFKLNDFEVSASKCHVYDKYTNKTKMGNDIAIIECELKTPFMFNYHTFPSLLQICSVPSCDKIGIFGYPGEKNGEFWGMSGNASFAINKSIISYDNIDTTGGQSGSPIVLDYEGITVIAGVHTNGGVKENYAAMLNAESVGWINKLIPKLIIGNLIVPKNKTVTLKSNHQHVFDRVVIESGGTLTTHCWDPLKKTGGTLLITALTDFIVEDTGRIDLNGKGYGRGEGPGTGQGIETSAGYGTSGVGGRRYGDRRLTTLHLGSGGYGDNGGAGGGALQIKCKHFELFGSIQANGGGRGSGGSIFITAGSLWTNTAWIEGWNWQKTNKGGWVIGEGSKFIQAIGGRTISRTRGGDGRIRLKVKSKTSVKLFVDKIKPKPFIG